jgi:Transposase DDE domain
VCALGMRFRPAFYAYSANYLIDIAAGIVVDVEATPAHKADEINATKTMIERVEDRFDLKPDRLIGDINYSTAAILGWMVEEKQIEPHVPVWDKTQRDDETLSSSDFLWAEPADEYRCPQGHVLRSRWRAFKTCVPMSPRPTPSSIDRANQIVRHAR